MLGFYYGFKGVLIGFIVSAPLGPVGLLCIKRVLNRGIFQGYFSGVGAALGDGFYAALAAFGLTFVMNFLIREEFWLRLIGGAFLIFLGIFWLKKKRTYQDFNQTPEKSQHIGQAFSTSFLLSLANPLTLLVYLALFSGFGLANASEHLYSAAFLVLGVIVGAGTWWLLLVQTVSLFKKKWTAQSLSKLNKACAILVVLLGFLILLTLIFHIQVFGKTF